MALTDPSDWPGSMPDLRTIDNLLRCSICFEYLNVAMIIPSCSHNYCSLCIRRYMKYKRQCPSCNIEVSASELCNNRTLDELVKTFIAVRPHILKLCKKSEAEEQAGCPPPDEEKTSKKSASPVQKQLSVPKSSPKKSSSTLTGHFTAFKPSKTASVRASEHSLGHTSSDIAHRSDVTIKTDQESDWLQTQSCNRHSTHSLVDPDDGDVIDISEDFETVQPTASTGSSPAAGQATPVRRHTTPSSSQAMPSGSQTTPSGSQTTPSGSRDKVECPVCSVPVPTKYINTHLDACLRRTEQQETNKRVTKRKRIPAMVWKLVPDKDLKKKMREYNLSTKGKRHEVIKRLEEFILMYNAQCDAVNPKSAEEIAREVERLEQLKNQQQLNDMTVNNLKVEKGQTEEQMQKARQEYLSANKDQFRELVAAARAQMNAVKKKSGKKDTAQASTSTKTSTSGLKEVTTKSGPASTLVENSAIQELDVVVILEDEVENRGDDSRTSEGSEIINNDGAELNRTECLFSDGEENEHGSNGRISNCDTETPENNPYVKQDSDVVLAEEPNKVESSHPMSGGLLDSDTAAVHNGIAEDLVAGFSGSGIHQQSDCKILVPSSPSVASKDGTNESQSQSISARENKSETSSLSSDPAPDSQDLLCIPESPLSVVAETRRRKRKKQDCGSNASDSGSSFGDGDTVLRRSKRERKTVK
ncbi:E3 ubiquitin-protein ligase RAD18-like isoform X2 [Acanthaster planci]|uniref:RING-type E3 ubiquitin transferase n=1 Tax=Acanthaster planci TaxID=133434 RepID=A0A8B7ZE22_ACAPL|nr:E3 ubiquitin-protein ligase RAD18-like isoform X2 [Acanthaster planci]